METGDMKIECPACKRRYAWKPELAGRRVKCKCGEPILVPTAMVEEVEEAPPPPDFDSDDFQQAAALTASMPTIAPPVSLSPTPVARPRAKVGASPAPATTAPAKAKLTDRWWFMLGLGAFFIVMAFAEFSRLSDMEAHGGSVRVTWYEYLAYSIAGKWGVLLCVLLLSGFCITLGVHKFLKIRRQ